MKKIKTASRDRTWAWVILVFFSILLIRVPLAAFLKHVQTYEDEWLYYSMAESLSEGKGFPVIYYGVFRYERVLYSLLISPAFLTTDRSLQFFLIDLINTLCQASGVFPAYLLAKDLLQDQKKAVYFALIYALLPDQAMNITFMCDPLFLVLSLWVFYFVVRILAWEDLTSRERILSLAGFGLSWIVAIYTKKAAALYGAVLLLTCLIKSIVRGIRRRKVNLLILLLIPLGIAGFAYVFRGKNALSLSLKYYTYFVLNKVKMDRTAFSREYVNNLLSYLAAIGFFPIALPYIYLDRLRTKVRYFLFYLTVSLGIFTVGAAQAGFEASVRSAHLRYVSMFWIPFLILFLLAEESRSLRDSADLREFNSPRDDRESRAQRLSGKSRRSKGSRRRLEEGNSMKDSPLSLQGASRRTASETEKLSLWEKVLWVVFCFFALLMMFVYHGVEMTSFGTPTASVDYTMLCWAEKWSGFELSYVAVITSIFLILMVLCLASRKAFLFLFFSLFMALQLYNNVVITDRLRGEYKLSEADAREALEIDAFVRQNPDAVFLVLESGSSTKDGLKITFSSKLSDTFLNQKNTLRVTGGDLLRMQEEGETREIRLSETALPIWRDKSSQASYPVQSVDYLIVPLDAAFYPDLTMCTEVDLGKGNYYKVYHLNDPDLLPRLYSPASLKSGHSVFSLDTGRKHTEPGFLSEYMDENENAVHTSGKDPGYALFGPKTTLQPGDYTVTIYLSNTEYPDEIVIGFTELASANMDLSDTMRDFHQGTASVKYQLHLTEPCEGFEIQVYTWVGGVTVEKVAVDYAPAEPET